MRPALTLTRHKHLPLPLLPLLLLAATPLSTAGPLSPDPIGHSPQIQDALLRRPPSTCPVLQDGATTTSFPWTHPPTCLSLILPEAEHSGRHETFCVYTNSWFASGRGISIVTRPESAGELGWEVWDSGLAREGSSEKHRLWEEREAEGKGRGLFARTQIEAGETIILESPVLVISREVVSSVSHARRRALLERAVEQLPEKTRGMVLALSRRGGESVMEDIININAVRAKVWDGTSHLLVVPEAARINHACRPNAYYRFSDSTLTLTVFALHPITPNTELTITYGFSTLPHPSRIEALKTHWSFTCTCPLCTSPPSTLQISNTRLADITTLKASLPTSITDIPQYIPLLPKLVALLEEEGLYPEVPVYEEMLAYAWAAVQEEGRAKAWAERAEEHWGVVAGNDSVERKRVGELRGDVKGHWTWGVWEGDIWEGVGKGHPWDEHEEDEHEHEHGHGHGHGH